jgi:hypothetical protein
MICMPCTRRAEHWRAGDGLQRPLRSRFRRRLMPGVDMTSAVKSRLPKFFHCL